MTDDVDPAVYLDAAPVAFGAGDGPDRAVFERLGAAARETLAGDRSGHDPHHAWRVFVLAVRLAVERGDHDASGVADGRAPDRPDGGSSPDRASDRPDARDEPADGTRRDGDGPDAVVPGAVGADLAVLGAAALLHDLHRVREADRFVHPVETLPELRSILDAAGFPGDAGAVCHAVAVHEEYAFRDGDDPERAPPPGKRREFGYDGPMEPATVEAELLQDADNLDAMGAVGVARTFQFGGAHGTPMWVPDRDVEGAPAYERADVTATTVDHFHEKLLRLREVMHTEPARRLAEDRHAFLADFLDRFEGEWLGRR